jgi:hypothetical protein
MCFFQPNVALHLHVSCPDLAFCRLSTLTSPSKRDPCSIHPCRGLYISPKILPPPRPELNFPPKNMPLFTSSHAQFLPYIYFTRVTSIFPFPLLSISPFSRSSFHVSPKTASDVIPVSTVQLLPISAVWGLWVLLLWTRLTSCYSLYIWNVSVCVTPLFTIITVHIFKKLLLNNSIKLI